ncbi:MAG: dockerin, partial [bacterium]|nr:dockerin [bacterium]
GGGADKTRLLFDFADPIAINISKYDRGEWIQVTGGHDLGSQKITVWDGGPFHPGDFVEIKQDNNPEVMYTDPKWNEAWADPSVGQMSRVEEVRGNILILNGPLHVDFDARLHPQIRTTGLVERAGVEDLYIKLSSTGDPVTIGMRNTAYCWVRNVESEYTSRNHVGISASYRCEIRDSYFHNSYDFGGGGHGYGVNLGHPVTDCLIENNAFKRLRHAMLVQVGACGNVFGYNYSTETRSEGDWIPCDVSLHGHYPSMNLFEGNTVQKIDVSDYWGPVGPGNTFLRNRVEGFGFRILDHSHGQNLIGNELVNPAASMDIHPSVNETCLSGNTIGGKAAGEAGAVPGSFYLTQKPLFFGNLPWPGPGAGARPNTWKIPAQVRFEGRMER